MYLAHNGPLQLPILIYSPKNEQFGHHCFYKL